jgi:multiple sugar transport system substrate-binding protein
MIFRALLVSTLLLAGCRGSDDGVTQIEYWNFGGVPNYIDWVRARVDSFNVANPHIRVVQSQKSWNMIREILYTNFTAGTGPDVMSVHANYAAEFGESNYYLPINTFPDFEEVRAWYLPTAIEATKYKGNYYGLPASGIAFTLICNKAMFDAEGVALPRTWSEFRDAARRLTRDNDGDGTIDQWGLVLMGGDRGGFAYRLAPFFFKAGADILSDDLTQVMFDSPEALSAVQLLADMHQIDGSITPGFLAYTHSEINDLFCSDRVAMSIEGPWFRGLVDDKAPGKEFHTIPVPVPDHLIDTYHTAPTLQDMVMYPISANSKNPEAAWRFIKYLRNPDADMSWVTRDLGALPTTRRAFESPEAESVEAMDVYENELMNARPWPAHPKIIAIVRNVIAPYGMKAVAGELSPEEALRLAAEEAQDILDNR